MGLTLRPYQDAIVDQTRTLMRAGTRSILIQSPTGSGKTALTAHMLGAAAAKGMGSWFVVHRRELIKQSIRAFAADRIKHGLIAAGFEEDKRPLVQIASILTLAKRYTRYRRPRLIVWDEAHHIAAGSWANIHRMLPDAYHIGLTATPERLDGAGLHQWFSTMVCGPDTATLIDQGYLAPYALYAPSQVNLRGVHTRMGDYARNELMAAVDKPTITGDAIAHYKRHAMGRRAVAFCVSVEHSEHVASQFNAAGIRAAHVDGDTDTQKRDMSIALFESGLIKVLCNVDLFGEGFDLPALEVAMLLRPTQSLALYLQQCGRALRPSPGKERAVILDHAGNCMRHGLPDDERDWSLDGKKARERDKDEAPPVRVCPKCYAAQFSGKPVCGYCGHVFAVQAREVEHVDGELEQVDPAQLRRQRLTEQGHAESLQDLVQLGKARGYKRPYLWAQHIFQARQAKRLARGRPVHTRNGGG